MIQELSKKKSYLIAVCSFATLGTSIPLGYNASIVGSLADLVQSWCKFTFINRFDIVLIDAELNLIWAIIVSIFFLSAATSSLCGAWIADKFGRKKSIIFCALLNLIGAIFFSCSRYVELIEFIIIARIFVGFSSGLSTGIVPMYISEISPLSLRGPLSTFFSLTIAMGVVLGQICSLEQTLGTPTLWNYSFSMYLIPVLIFLIACPYFPESPKYLYVVIKQKERSVLELQRLRDDKASIDIEIDMLEKELTNRSKKISLTSIIFDKDKRLRLILTCLIQGCQQLCGIASIAYYCVPLFMDIGLNTNESKLLNLMNGLAYLFGACCSPLIVAIMNRRPTLIISSILCGLCLIILTVSIELVDKANWLSYVCIGIILIFLLAFQMGLGSIPYFIGTELFENASRPSAMALGSLSIWSCSFLATLIFPIIQLSIGSIAFVPNILICFMLAIILQFYLPETRNKDPSEINVGAFVIN